MIFIATNGYEQLDNSVLLKADHTMVVGNYTATQREQFILKILIQ